MDNAASCDHIPGEDLRAPPPSPEDLTRQSSGILGQDEEYKLWSEDDEIFNPGMTNFPHRFGPIARPNGALQLSSRGIMPDAPENTRISEDVTQTTGLQSSTSESIEVNTVESIHDSSHETVNSVSTEAGERKEASNEMTPMSPSESLPLGISANAALPMVRPQRLTEIVQEEKERREASGMGKIDMSLREKRSLGRNALSRPCAGGTNDKSSGS